MVHYKCIHNIRILICFIKLEHNLDHLDHLDRNAQNGRPRSWIIAHPEHLPSPNPSYHANRPPIPAPPTPAPTPPLPRVRRKRRPVFHMEPQEFLILAVILLDQMVAKAQANISTSNSLHWRRCWSPSSLG